jgi:uncharacterized membrane protein YbhN (UPF0104 family)
MKKFAKVLVSLLVSAVALFVAFRGIEFSKVWLTLKSVSVWPIVPLLFFLGLHLVVRSLRWRYLLPESQEDPPTIRTLFDSLMLGAFASFILPLRAGEFVRPLVLTKWSRYSFSTAFVYASSSQMIHK